MLLNSFPIRQDTPTSNVWVSHSLCLCQENVLSSFVIFTKSNHWEKVSQHSDNFHFFNYAWSCPSFHMLKRSFKNLYLWIVCEFCLIFIGFFIFPLWILEFFMYLGCIVSLYLWCLLIIAILKSVWVYGTILLSFLWGFGHLLFFPNRPGSF